MLGLSGGGSGGSLASRSSNLLLEFEQVEDLLCLFLGSLLLGGFLSLGLLGVLCVRVLVLVQGDTVVLKTLGDSLE